jgi:MFS family permease
VDDWVNTQPVIATLFGPDGTQNAVAKFVLILNKSGTEMQPEGVVNLNALLIMSVCFVVAALSARLRATTSIFLGTALSALAFVLFGATFAGWLVIVGVLLFSLGEMLSSPKFFEYIGNFAPGDKKAMYLGFAQIPIMVGMMLEGKIGPVLYDHFASKERFARDLLVERGQTLESVAMIPQGEAFGRLVDHMQVGQWQVTAELAARHHVGVIWTIMALIGSTSGVAMLFYGRWVKNHVTA